jgi:hypothetical protein
MQDSIHSELPPVGSCSNILYGSLYTRRQPVSSYLHRRIRPQARFSPLFTVKPQQSTPAG